MKGSVTSIFSRSRRSRRPRCLRADLAVFIHRGQLYARLNICISNCPYQPGSVERDLWIYGWRMVKDRHGLNYVDHADWVAEDLLMLERLWRARVTPSLIVQILCRPRQSVLLRLNRLEMKHGRKVAA